MIGQLTELLPEYREIFIKVIEKHKDIEENLQRLNVENKSYIQFKEKMRRDNE